MHADDDRPQDTNRAKKELLLRLRAKAGGPSAPLRDEDIRIDRQHPARSPGDFIFIDSNSHDKGYIFNSDPGDPIHVFLPNPYLRILSASGDDDAS